MLYLEQKYIGYLSVHLNGCKKIDKTNYNFRCPICGDSENKNKKRGYLYLKKGKYSFFCHNCSASRSLDSFMKEVNPSLYNQYVYEKIQESKPTPVDPDKQYKMDAPVFKPQEVNPLKSLYKISELSSKHPAKEYLVSRNIPNEYFDILHYVDGFKSWINGIIPNKFENTSKDDGRIIIPLLDTKGQLNGVQGRSFNPNDSIRYITIMFDENAVKMFGLDRVDITKTIYIFEGPFDAMFIKNSVARCGGHLNSVDALLPKDKLVIVYDNEPRNKEIARNIKDAIMDGYRVCIDPKFNAKDLNEAINNGMTIDQLKHEIDSRTFSGTEAMLEWNIWKK